MKELPIPPSAVEDHRSIQMIQAWLAKEQIHVSLNIGMWRHHPEVTEEHGWGCLLADVAWHVANGLNSDEGKDKNEVVRLIRESFLAELDNPTTSHLGDFVAGG